MFAVEGSSGFLSTAERLYPQGDASHELPDGQPTSPGGEDSSCQLVARPPVGAKAQPAAVNGGPVHSEWRFTMQLEIIAETNDFLDDYMETMLAYNRRDALYFALLPLIAKRMALYPKFADKMWAARGRDKVEHFNQFMERLIRVWSVKS